MKKKYEIKGMSCGGCVSHVKKALLQQPDVTEVEVELNAKTASITMSKPVDIKELQTELDSAGHYSIRELVEN